MPQNSTSDVIVIGGGVVGLSVAYELAKASLRVRVLEKGVCGKEASWAGAGVLQCGSWHRTDPLVHLLRESLRTYACFAEELRDRTGIDTEFVPCGSFEVLLEDQQYRMALSEVKAAEAHAATWGRPVLEMLPAMFRPAPARAKPVDKATRKNSLDRLEGERARLEGLLKEKPDEATQKLLNAVVGQIERARKALEVAEPTQSEGKKDQDKK